MNYTDDLLTMSDIADHLGVKYGTIRSFRSRYTTGAHPFPKPIGLVGKSEVWLVEQINEWNEKRPGQVGNPNWTKGKQRPA